MTTNVILVDVAALLTVAWIVWYFWLSEKRATRATVAAGGAQETIIRVKGGYDPDTIEVEAGRPVRLRFLHQETAACSERVEFPDSGISRPLPEGEEVVIELTPEAGEHDFTCQTGMLRGRLVARARGRGA